jgi:DNA-directed RNA polymerase III subunit RPC3
VDPNFLEKMRKKKERVHQEEVKAEAEAQAAASRGGHGAGTIEDDEADDEPTTEEIEDQNGPEEEDATNRDRDITRDGNIPEVVEDESGADPDDPFTDDPPAKISKVTFSDDLLAEDRDTKILQLKDHLTLLAADEYCFIRHIEDNAYGEWTVDFEDLVQRLREVEIDSFIKEAFGKSGHRLVQMMRKDGKLDQTHLPNAALLNQRGIRTKLAEMQMAGVVEVQGVPRDSAHSVNRMIFLWYFDHDRVSAIFLNNVYKVMSRNFQRLEIERQRSRDILSLSERTDVTDGTEKLSEGHLKTLGAFKDKEDKLLGQIIRCDGLVGIFRDY